jgi:hypothetical protein
LCARAANAQNAASANKATATIAGRITLDNNGAPGVQVIIKPHNDGVFSISFGGEEAPAISATTDVEGRYRLTGVTPGSYRISAFAPAYAIEGESNPFMPGKTVSVAEGESVENLDFSLARGGVISGRVTDEKDRPAIAAPVTAYKLDSNGDIRRQGFPNFVRWETDDRGMYRIFGLEAGKYLVAAGSSSDDGMANFVRTGGDYRRTFHPDAVDEKQARVLEIKSGEEVGAIDIKIAPPVKGYVVTGRVVESDTDNPVSGVTININAIRRTGGDRSVRSAVSNSLGEFRVENLPTSGYRAFIIITGKPGSPPRFGDEITFDVVDGDVSGLELRMQSGATISGTATIEGSSDPALLAKLADVGLITQSDSRPAGMGAGPFGSKTIGPNGAFRLANVRPGKVRIMMGMAPSIGATEGGFSLLRVEQNGVEVKELIVNAGEQITGVRLVFAYGNGAIAGRVEIKGGALSPGAWLRVAVRREDEPVIGVPINSVAVDNRGQFLINALSPGTYRLVLIGDSVNLPKVERLVVVSGDGRQEVTLVVDLTSKERDK